MTPDEAADLAILIADGWPGRGMSAETWERKLANLDYAPAAATFTRLQDTDNDSPSWAKFYAEYRSSVPTPRRYAEPCSMCDGTGWQSVENPHPYPHSAVKPCWCSNGRANEPAYEKAVEENKRVGQRFDPKGFVKSLMPTEGAT